MAPVSDEWQRYKTSIAHVIRLEEVFRLCNKSSPHLAGHLAFVELLLSAGFYLFEAGLGNSALTILRTAEEVCDHEVASANLLSPRDADSVTNADWSTPGPLASGWTKFQATALQISWAIMATSQGISSRQNSTEHITKVLSLRTKYASTEHPNEEKYRSRVLLANALNDMAYQLLDNEEYDAAEAHLCASLKMKEELEGERSMPAFQFAEHKKNLAIAKLGQGKREEAVSLSRDAVAVLSQDKEEAAVYSLFQFIHAICLANVGLLAEALPILQDCLELRVSAFGRSGMHTLNTHYAIASVQYNLGLYEDARLVSPFKFSNLHRRASS